MIFKNICQLGFDDLQPGAAMSADVTRLRDGSLMRGVPRSGIDLRLGFQRVRWGKSDMMKSRTTNEDGT